MPQHPIRGEALLGERYAEQNHSSDCRRSAPVSIRVSLAEVGEHLGLSENAARMRVERALDKLRRLLAKRGITSTFAALSVLLTAHAVQAAPAGLVAGLSASSLAAATAVTSNIGILKIMASIKLKAGIAALVTAAAVAPIVITHHVRSQQAAVDEYREQERAHLRQAGQIMTALLSFAQRDARLPDTLEEAGLAGQEYELLFKGALPDRTQASSTIVGSRAPDCLLALSGHRRLSVSSSFAPMVRVSEPRGPRVIDW
jgi:Sigma-70, region 4